MCLLARSRLRSLWRQTAWLSSSTQVRCSALLSSRQDTVEGVQGGGKGAGHTSSVCLCSILSLSPCSLHALALLSNQLGHFRQTAAHVALMHLLLKLPTSKWTDTEGISAHEMRLLRTRRRCYVGPRLR